MSPARNPTPCTAWPCPHLTPPPCPVHGKRDPALERARNERRSTSADVYRSARWKRLRRRTLLAQPWCATPRCHLPATDADHIIPIEEAPHLAYEPSNVQGLCHACHSRKTAEDVARRRQRR